MSVMQSLAGLAVSSAGITAYQETADERLSVAKAQLLAPGDLTETHLQVALAEMFQHEVDYADLYFQLSRSEGWSLEEGIVKSGNFSIEQGVGVRAVCKEKTAFAYSDAIDLPSLMAAARATRTIAAQGSGAVSVASRMKPRRGHDLYATIDPLVQEGAAQKVALLERVERMAKQKDPCISRVSVGLSAEYDIVLVARSDGLLAADIRPLVRCSVSVIAERAGRREQGSSGGGGRVDLSYFSDEILAGYAAEAVSAALTNLDARPAPAGTMTVVLGSGWPGVLLHEAVGHGLEGDFNRKGSSVFSGRQGQRVAAPGVTVVDDGTLPLRRGSLNIDDEGNPSQCNVLIEDGYLRSYLQDDLNARLMGVPVTGNGRRESFAHLPMPRMTNTYMLNGECDPEEIIASVDRGLYAANFGGGQVDITNGKFVFSASEAWWIEGGRLQYPVKGATLIGNGPDVLTRVTLIGRDMRLDAGIGVCGKDGQSVPVGVGQPTLKIEGLTVGGTT